MIEAPPQALLALEAVADGRSVADPEVALLIVGAAAAAHPEALGPDHPTAAPTEPMILAAVDSDGGRWVAVSVRLHDPLSQVVAAWTIDPASLTLEPDDPIWFDADRSTIDPHLGVTTLDGPDDYPTWVDACIGDQLACGRLWADYHEIDLLEVGTVDAVLDDLLFPPEADDDAETIDIVHDSVHCLVATAVEANHPGEIDGSAGVVGIAASIRADAEGPYLAAALLVLDHRGRCAQAHLTVDLRPWAEHPMVAVGGHMVHDRSLIGGRVGITGCVPEEFPTWPQPAMGTAA